MNSQQHSYPVIRTKLYASPQPGDYVSRDRLLGMMDKAVEMPLTLVSAPAGFGKSVLVSDWLQRQDHSIAWLSLDEDDSDLRQFIAYLVAAVEVVVPGACPTIAELSTASEMPPLPLLSAQLINDLDDIDQPLTIVLDDYHHLDRLSPVHEIIDKLLVHPPDRLHIVIVTRRDPPLSLARLRAGKRVVEVRMQDLQFTEAEITELVATNMGVDLSGAALDNLQLQTEGWAAGLRLVLLAVRHASDPEAVIKGISGGVPQVQEYLLDEVLEGLSSRVRAYLMKSAVLGRFCADLIEAVCAPETASSAAELSGDDFLSQLQRSNTFILALDPEGQWFRFHHLFRDILQRHLRQQFAEGDIEQLYLRASNWFESRSLIDEAIEYALLGADSDHAADIIARHYHEVLNQDRFYVLDQWLNKLPAEVIENRASLLLCRAWIFTFRQQLTGLIPLLSRLESLLKDEAGGSELRTEFEFFKGSVHFWSGDFEQSERELESVVNKAPEGRLALLAEANVHLSLARYLNGHMTRALEGLNHQITMSGSTDSLVLSRIIGSTSIIHLLSGDLPQAKIQGKRMRQSAASSGSLLNVSWGYYLEGLSELHCLDLREAQDNFVASIDNPYVTDAREAVDAFAGLALAQEFLQMTADADTTIQRMINFAEQANDSTLIDVVHSCEARINLLRGNLAAAISWEKSCNSLPDLFGLFIWLESSPLTRARVLIAEGSTVSLKQADQLLQQICELCETYHLDNKLIEATVLLSRLRALQGQPDAALQTLQEAINLAMPGHWIRPFFELGQPMTELLEKLDLAGAPGEFVGRILSIVNKARAKAPTGEIPVSHGTTPAANKPRAAQARTDNMSDDLTNRELDILEMLLQRLQNKEIASKLFISTHTVNYHLKNIYQKLDVGSRRQAVKKAVEMGILESS